MMNNAEQIVETIQDMITIHSQEANAHLMRIGAIALESENIGEHARYYYESRARVFILNDLLEKIAKTPDEDTRKAKHNPFCNEDIRAAQIKTR